MLKYCCSFSWKLLRSDASLAIGDGPACPASGTGLGRRGPGSGSGSGSMPYASCMNCWKISPLVLLMVALAFLASGEVTKSRCHVLCLLTGENDEPAAGDAHKYTVAVVRPLDAHVRLVIVLRVVQIDDRFHD